MRSNVAKHLDRGTLTKGPALQKKCARCEASFTPNKIGRPQKFCSKKCCNATFHQSEKGSAVAKRYWQSEKGRIAQDRYKHKYNRRPYVMETKRQYMARRLQDPEYRRERAEQKRRWYYERGGKLVKAMYNEIYNRTTRRYLAADRYDEAIRRAQR